MAASQSLTGYSIVVRRKHARTDAEQLLGNYCATSVSVLAPLERYLRELDVRDDNTVLTPIEVHGPDAENPNVVWAWIEAGEIGVRSSLRNLEDDADRYERTQHHAENVQVFVLCKAEPRRKLGYFVVHVPHGRGIKGVLSTALVDRFRQEHDEFSLRIDTAVPADVIRQTIENGRIHEVRFIKRRPERSEFDRLGEYLADPREGRLETMIAGNQNVGLIKRNFERWINREADAQALLTFDSKQYDALKVEVIVGNRRRTIDVTQQSIGRVLYDVTEELNYEDGRPTSATMLPEALDLVADLEASTGG
jgi:hypothetical protein